MWMAVVSSNAYRGQPQHQLGCPRYRVPRLCEALIVVRLEAQPPRSLLKLVYSKSWLANCILKAPNHGHMMSISSAK